MLVRDFFESPSPKTALVWSKRGDAIEKRVEKPESKEIKARKHVVTKDSNGGQ